MTAPLRTVLYVEDEPDIRTVARIALETVGGLAVRTCESGEEAVRLATAAAPDLILLDVMMPGMDGPGTLAAIRGLPELAETPVVFLTAKVSPGDIERLRALGATDVIGKPFDPMALPQRIRDIWDRHRAATGAGDDLDRRLEGLNRDYVAGLPDRLAAIDAALGDLCGESDPSAALDALTRHAHAIAGSAGTFGYPDWGEIAARLEELCGRVADAASPPSTDDIARIEALVATLRAEAPGP